ncbi:DUF1330 domain-containing protein [Pseudoxanthomonas sp. PXM03]|jgi:uncharacterized protein (DUF1330 family)|uniref:DUF1330 domain-containing protein n=1 Tax=Pseudoxanthomonas sp. PXM03 TaxID=2769284 RepID=UPI00177B988E|nr:DUF1330 domain-containing protein [Pseudoxanthomonas sp. PXM03]MBD9434765.1 DUF1330 domain-containing protein [Pseudoxanthomonas sp. PXM03]
MAAYLVGNIEIQDEYTIEEYRRRALPLVEKFGGKPLVIDATPVYFEGNWIPRNMILLEFPNMAAIRGLLTSEEYAPLAIMRQASTHSDLVAFSEQ